ncbi:hypothetical protein, partial [Rossellomorea marisflavi]|uniref:hypothetical protein n=1 Tax=Rossellomorea marisflavi TaxID=189381 RepID=UPI003511BDF5
FGMERIKVGNRVSLVPRKVHPGLTQSDAGGSLLEKVNEGRLRSCRRNRSETKRPSKEWG